MTTFLDFTFCELAAWHFHEPGIRALPPVDESTGYGFRSRLKAAVSPVQSALADFATCSRGL
ncbi:MAG: hypothetical protein Q7U34_08600 [Anaerolineales bacterium]|nr:hypothetical protein [Anaerolineales bacterium]MDO9347897.1 hypothetical protein [Anaerolineales bacterium]